MEQAERLESTESRTDMLPSGSQNAKALGYPGRCGLLRERSRLARLRPVDAIRRGASSGAHALWSSGLDSRDPPSCGVPNEFGLGHGLGSPLRCQRARVKFMRQHAVRVAGPDRIIFCPIKTQPQSRRSFTEENSQRNSVPDPAVTFASCNAWHLS